MLDWHSCQICYPLEICGHMLRICFSKTMFIDRQMNPFIINWITRKNADEKRYIIFVAQ